MAAQLIYIHGFNSSPQSFKAQQFSRWLKEKHPQIKLAVPALSPYPAQAMQQLRAIAEDASAGTLGLIGSSLGGFYATYLAEHYGCRACLINPSVFPFQTLAKYLGENQNFHTLEKYDFTQAHVDELQTLYIERISRPQDLLLLQQTGDETLDYREACARYAAGPAIIEAGGDHAFQNAERYFGTMLRFLLRQ